MQGESLVPIVRGEKPADWRTEYFYDHYFIPNRIPACPLDAVPEALGRIASRGGSVAEDILRRLRDDPDIAGTRVMKERVEYGLSLIDATIEPAPGILGIREFRRPWGSTPTRRSTLTTWTMPTTSM